MAQSAPPPPPRRKPIALPTSRLREWRILNGFSQQELADLTGLSLNVISRVEWGLRKFPPSVQVQIARALDVRVKDLFDPPTPLRPSSGPRKQRPAIDPPSSPGGPESSRPAGHAEPPPVVATSADAVPDYSRLAAILNRPARPPTRRAPEELP